MIKFLLFPFYFLVYFFYLTFKAALFCIKIFFAIIKNLFASLFNKRTVAIEDIDSMDGHEFEFFSKKILEKDAFSNVEVTKGAGDQGIDVLATLDGKKVGIQCKNYSGNVGNKAVQEAIAGGIYYDLDQVFVLTNSYFTQSAKDLAKKAGVTLLDRDYLLNKVKKFELADSPPLSIDSKIKPDIENNWSNESFIFLPIDDQLFLVWKEMQNYQGESPISHLQQTFRLDYLTATELYDKYLDDPTDNHITLD